MNAVCLPAGLQIQRERRDSKGLKVEVEPL
jgi:hypothetical protein